MSERRQDGRFPTRRDVVKGAAAGALGALAGLGAPALFAEGEKKPAGKTLLILGGTAFLGPEIVEAAKERGFTVTLFNRGKTNPGLFPDLEKLHGDRNGDLKALEGRKWDVVVDTSGYFPRQVRASAGLLAPSVKHYVFISSISVYADTSKPGADETSPVGRIKDETTEKITEGSYGPLKALCEEAAEKAMPGRVTVVRPGLIVGPGDRSDRFTYWPVRVDRGGEVLAPGTPADPIQLIDVRDLADWTVKMAEAREKGVYNATGPKGTLTMGEMLAACKKASGSSATFTWVDEKTLLELKIAPWSDMPCWLPMTGETAGANRISAAQAIGKGLTFRPIETTAKDTLLWWKAQPADRRAKPRAGLAAEREAELLKTLHERKAKG